MKTIASAAFESLDRENCWFNPGCAMSLYRPELVEPMLTLLRDSFAAVKLHTLCCHHNPQLPAGATIINNCAGCDRRFRSEYQGIQTITIWEILDHLDGLCLPKYDGLTVSVHDSCSFRQKPQVHAAVRNLLRKMNIKVMESEFSGTKSICCGDNFYSHIPNDQVVEFQKKRAAQMPCDDVVVYCIGCVRSMTVGGKRPLYMPDLILAHQTKRMDNTLDEYHNELNDYIAAH